MLVMLLFRLGVDRRAAEIGILLAVGFPAGKIRRILLVEGLIVAVAGSLLGAVAGIGYAALMLLGLRTWWLAAVATPFLTLYITPLSLAIGATAGAVIALFTIGVSLRRIRRASPRRLLAGDWESQASQWTVRRRSILSILVRDMLLLTLVVAPTVVLIMAPLQEDFRAGAFFGAGALALVALLWIARLHLRAGATGPAVAVGRGNLVRMAMRNAARNPGRSTLSIGLAASACFLIVAVSAFRVDPAQEAPAFVSGNGGFDLVAMSDRPIYHDFNTPTGRESLDFSDEDSRLLSLCTIYSFRVKPGDDASCLNVYQPPPAANAWRAASVPQPWRVRLGRCSTR